MKRGDRIVVGLKRRPQLGDFSRLLAGDLAEKKNSFFEFIDALAFFLALGVGQRLRRLAGLQGVEEVLPAFPIGSVELIKGWTSLS